MATAPFEHASDASAALREIVADHGVDGLSQPGLVARLLSDLLPDAPGVARVLTAAAEHRVADMLRDHEATGMDAATAARLTAASFATATMFTPEVCNWVVGEFAVAAGLPPGGTGLPAEAATVLPAVAVDLGKDDAATSARTLVASPAGAGRQSAPQAPVTASRPEPVTAGPGPDQPGQDSTTATAGNARPADSSARPPASRRASWPMAGAAAAVIAVIVGVVIWAPWSGSPPQPPGGLNAVRVTDRSVTLGWAQPSSGREPSSYVVLRNGNRIGSVPGSSPVDNVTGLDPDTGYNFQVEAVSGSQRSAPSKTLTVTTGTPPLTAAILTGTWLVNQHITRSSNEPGVYSAGRNDNYNWDFTPQCANVSCPVNFDVNIDGVELDGTLRHSGISYSGTLRTNELLECGKFAESSTVNIVITVSEADPSGQAWTASDWSGSFAVRDVANEGGGCGPSSWTSNLKAVHS